jgi:hypothetical protein
MNFVPPGGLTVEKTTDDAWDVAEFAVKAPLP